MCGSRCQNSSHFPPDILLQQHYGAINAVPNCYTMNTINSTLASLLQCVNVIVLIVLL